MTSFKFRIHEITRSDCYRGTCSLQSVRMDILTNNCSANFVLQLPPLRNLYPQVNMDPWALTPSILLDRTPSTLEDNNLTHLVDSANQKFPRFGPGPAWFSFSHSIYTSEISHLCLIFLRPHQYQHTMRSPPLVFFLSRETLSTIFFNYEIGGTCHNQLTYECPP